MNIVNFLRAWIELSLEKILPYLLQLIKNHQRNSIVLLAGLLLTLAGMGKERMSVSVTLAYFACYIFITKFLEL